MAISLSSVTQRSGAGLGPALTDYVLPAAPAKLKWVVHQNPGEAHKYTFKDGQNTYTSLEYALKCQDADSAVILLKLKTEISKNIIQFYIDCLTEDTLPNVALLHLLFDKLPEAPVLEAGNFSPLVTRAMNHMRNYRMVHWDVIDALLMREKRVEGMQCVTPVNVLLNADSMLIGRQQRTPQDEEEFLRRMVYYLSLERRYYPESGLTLEQFKQHTPWFLTTIADLSIHLKISSFVTESFSLWIDQPIDPEGKEILEKGRGIHLELTQTQKKASHSLVDTIWIYHSYFQKLVNKSSFIECFEPIILDSILEELKRLDSPQARITIAQLQQLGQMGD